MKYNSHFIFKDLLAGLISGVQVLVYGISFTMLIFAGAPQFLGLGITLALVSNFILAIIIALGSSLHTNIASIQHSQAVILSAMVTTLAAQMVTFPESTISTTLYFALVSTTLLAGFILFLLGKLRLGNSIRFIPFPVIVGFLAGVGWLLIKGAFLVMTEKSLDLKTIQIFFTKDILQYWIPGILLGLLLWFFQRKKIKPLLLLSVIIGSIILFFVGTKLLGFTIQDLKTHNWLLGSSLTSLHPWKMIWNYSFSAVHWEFVLSQWVNMIIVIVLTIVTLLLNASAYEIQRGESINFNRELMVTGAANLVSGTVGGGIPGFQTITVTLLNENLGAHSQLSGILVGLISLSALFLGINFFGIFPKFIIASVIIYLGIDMLIANLYRNWYLLPKIDYFLALAVFLMIAFGGLIPGVLLGIMIALISFVVHYSKIKVVKTSINGSLLQSNVERGSLVRRFLQRNGKSIYILRLQNYLFFGNIYLLVFQLIKKLKTKNEAFIQFIILDFAYVGGFDSSSVMGFEKLFLTCKKFDIQLIFSQLPKQSEHFLKRFIPLIPLNETTPKPSTPVILSAIDLDHALEWCEEQTLTLITDFLTKKTHRNLLEKIFPDDAVRTQALSYFQYQEFPPSHILFKQGSDSDCLYLIEEGEIDILLEKEQGTIRRINTLKKDTVLGEIGLYGYTTRTATAITKTSCKLHILTAKQLEHLQSERPDIALLLHRYIAKLAMKRLVHMDQMIRVLLD